MLHRDIQYRYSNSNFTTLYLKLTLLNLNPALHVHVLGRGFLLSVCAHVFVSVCYQSTWPQKVLSLPISALNLLLASSLWSRDGTIRLWNKTPLGKGGCRWSKILAQWKDTRKFSSKMWQLKSERLTCSYHSIRYKMKYMWSPTALVDVTLADLERSNSRLQILALHLVNEQSWLQNTNRKSYHGESNCTIIFESDWCQNVKFKVSLPWIAGMYLKTYNYIVWEVQWPKITIYWLWKSRHLACP